MAPTTRASSPAMLVDPERFDTTSTTTPMGTEATTTRQTGAQVPRLGQAPEPLVEDGEGQQRGHV